MARILIVEDNPDLLTILSELLTRDYDVETARNGREGIERALDARPDLVIMDLQMPEMDGMEAARRIQEAVSPDRVPVLALTALAQSRDPETVLGTGHFDAYMSKPASIEEIRAKVEELLGSGSRAA